MSIAGATRTYSDSQASIYARFMAEAKTANVAVIYDELDKSCVGALHGSVLSAILPYLEQESAAATPEKWLGNVPIDCRHVVHIATANDITLLPEHVRSRFCCVAMGTPEAAHLDVILDGILDDLTAQHRLTERPSIDAAAMVEVRRRFAADRSIRRAKRAVESAVAAAVVPADVLAMAHRPRSDDDMRRTATHEAGHVVCGLFAPHPIPVALATITPDEEHGYGGFVLERETWATATAACLKSRLVFWLGGRAAEIAAYGAEYVGAGMSHDLERTREAAKRFVTDLAMDGGTLGGDDAASRIAAVLAEAEAEAAAVVAARSAEIAAITDALLVRDTLTGDDLAEIVASVRGLVPDGCALRNTTL